MSLIHLIYTSAAASGFDEDCLTEVLVRARPNNESLDVTGMLLFTEGSILQALEGEAPVVDALYQKISRDPRHHQIAVLVREPIAERVFGNWTMGFAKRTYKELKIDGVNDFFGDRSCFAELAPGRIKKVLDAFAEGRWRTRPVLEPS